MKTKLIALLKTSFVSKGFNQKELESLADLVIGQNTLTDESTDEDLSTAVTAAKPTADFVQSVASRQVSDVKKPKVEDPAKPAEDPAKPAEPATPADMPEWAKGLLTSVGALTQGLQAIQAEKVGNTRREQFIASMKGTSEDYQTKELKKFDRMVFEKDEDFTAFIEDTKDDHATAIQDDANKGLGFDKPAGGAGGKFTTKEASKEEVDSVLDKIM